MELNRKWVGVGGGGQRHGTLDPHRAKIETGGRGVREGEVWRGRGDLIGCG